MNELKEQIKKRSIEEKISLFEFLRDLLNLKSIAKVASENKAKGMERKSYNGVRLFSKLKRTNIEKTVYLADVEE